MDDLSAGQSGLILAPVLDFSTYGGRRAVLGATIGPLQVKPFQKLKAALVTGFFIVLPAWLALVLLLKLIAHLSGLLKPVSGHLPRGVDHPELIAALLFVLLCLAVGVVVQTAVGRAIGDALGENVLNRLPGYQSLRAIARQAQDADAGEGFKPALVEVEDGCLAPAFLIEIHPDGRATVFMPSVPTPMAGSIFIMPNARVHPIDVPVATMMRCISHWGSGSGELLAALRPFP